ncbi:MAG: hypothetical protein KDC78_08720 [Aequorivita sp.]|nr:hypothetical protein [Aequorivita sp.]MCB0465738.1 hypothetical protein [Aequorivita sp.]|tara:strand:+ start:3501 stop:3683 length:183 start_codon:yes stop_codon:yes gene_type:complete
MENPFKAIVYSEKLPVTLKEKVMGNVATIKLILDIADLTMIKYPSSIENIFKTTKNNKKQ